MKVVYCAKCGMKLKLYRKALPAYSTVITIIEPHVCAEELIEFDLTPIQSTPLNEKNKDNKFVQNLNDLNSGGLKDRRPDKDVRPKPETSSAPPSISDTIDAMMNPKEP